MSKKKVISFFELEKWEEKYLREKLSTIKNLSLNFFEKPISKSIINKIKDTDILGVFIYSQVDKNIIDSLANLKFITTMSTGFDHIDLATAKLKNIKVSSVPFYGENTVAEHAFALILSLSRKIIESEEKARRYDFNLDNLRGFDLKGKTLGIIGLGHIGEHVARIAKGFEMEVIVNDPRKDNKKAKKLGIKYISLNSLLKRSDIISLHAPYNKKTHHLINKDKLRITKKGAYIINTARGGLIDTEALLSAINKKIIAGAGIDVLEEECFIKEEKELLAKPFKKSCDFRKVLQGHVLIQNSRVLVTPHNAFNSEEALARILDTTVENIKGFLEGKHKHRVN